MYTRRLDVDDLQSRVGPFDGRVAYARSKRAEVVLAERWAEELAGTGVVVHSMHPGWADTPGIKTSIPDLPARHAPAAAHAASRAPTRSSGWPRLRSRSEVTGRFWCDRHVRATHRLARTQRDRGGPRSALACARCARSGGVRADMISLAATTD